MSDQIDKILNKLQRLGHLQKSNRIEKLTGGRTNTVWKVTDQNTSLVVKSYVQAPPNPLFRNQPQDEVACLRALGASGLAPRLVTAELGSSAPWICYRYVAGETWKTGVAGVAACLRQIHDSPAPYQMPVRASGSDALTRETHSILDLCPRAMADVLRFLGPSRPPVPQITPKLLHGDPVPANILITDRGVCFIDWQCPALGDPCEDLATFLSPAMQLLYRGAELTAQEEDQFLGTYGERAVTHRYRRLKPWFHWRMAAYCLWRSQTGVPDYEQGLAVEIAALKRYKSLNQKLA